MPFDHLHLIILLLTPKGHFHSKIVGMIPSWNKVLWKTLALWKLYSEKFTVVFYFSHFTMHWWNCIFDQHWLQDSVGLSLLWVPPTSAQVAQCSVRATSMLCLVDCDRPADRTEDPDSHRSGHLWIPKAAVHLDQPRWSWNWEGDPGFPRDIQCQAAHIHHLGQPRPWQDPGKACWQSIHLRISATGLVPDCNLCSALEAKSFLKDALGTGKHGRLLLWLK